MCQALSWVLRKKTGKYSRSCLATDPAFTCLHLHRKEEKVEGGPDRFLLSLKYPPSLKSSCDGTNAQHTRTYVEKANWKVTSEGPRAKMYRV